GCQRGLGSNGFHIDHIMPRALGGADGIRNRQLMCYGCNLRKGKMHPVEFYRSIGMLC
ncbi:MAG: HNH endonuclease, partial [Patescibacteria group bacterium]|nr:HNH endonuclease [Patescibacteria group bacterium]